MKYFNETITTLEELKKAYKDLVKELHPDLNPGKDTTAAFQEMGQEYAKLFEKLKNVHKNSKGETYSTKTAEDIHIYKDIIDKLVRLNLNIEIIGSWIWVSGDTKQHKELLKELKFKWSANKAAWYYHEGGFRKASKKDLSLDDLREYFDSTAVRNKKDGEIVVA